MKETTEEELLSLYNKDTKNNCYCMMYPNTQESTFNIVLNDQSTFQEQLDLEKYDLKTFPALIYVTLFDKKTIEISRSNFNVSTKFFIFESFELFSQYVEEQRKSYNYGTR